MPDLMRVLLAVARYAITRLTNTGHRVSSFKGEDMAATKTDRAPKSEPIVTIDDIDEALLHTSMAATRNEGWQRWADALLDERNRLARQRPQRETRVMHPEEYR